MIVGSETGGRWLGGIHRQLRAMLLSPFVRQRLGTFVVFENRDDLAVLAERLESGEVRPVVDRTYRLSETPMAIQRMRNGHGRGKLVIEVD